MGGENVKLFLSCVSDEFGAYRDELRRKLTRPNVEVKIQEDFKLLGGDTLKMLEDYIAQCEAVVHFVGDMAGSSPAPTTVDDLLTRRPDLAARLADKGMLREALASLTYTQWEAWLAIGFGKDLIIVAPADGVARGPAFRPTDASRASEALNRKRLRAVNRYPGPPFTSADNLVAQIFASAVIDALVKAAAKPAGQPRNLPFASIGRLFVGRDKALEELRAALASAPSKALSVRVINGLGGIGKTRLAIEYAWAHAGDYSALLFVSADGEAALNAGLAALAGAESLDLPEKEAREDAAKTEAVLRWLGAHPTWLLILDNVDDEQAVAAVGKLMARLNGGHVIVTARASNFPAALPTLELDALGEESATQFLLERTRGKRVEAADDETRASEIARELGGLALGLEQAGAYIAKLCIPFARYLKLWSENREKALAWSDATLTGSEEALAMAWVTSVDRLLPASRRLLDRLAILAPDPIPNSLFDVPVPGEAADYDAYEARAGLADFSLIAQAKGDDGAARGFVVHRLVQDFARRAMSEERRAGALREALKWVNAAFVGEPYDVRSWPVLNPLAPHALAVAGRADEAGIAEPTGGLLGTLGSLLEAKGRYFEAEPLYRRALAIWETNLGQDHPQVAIGLNNLALQLQATNRLGEAEPLFRRALAIAEATLGPDHPDVAIDLNNLAGLLQETNRPDEAEPLFRRALAIHEASLGQDHPQAATGLNNLANLLQATNRLAEAEPLYRRALAIDEASYGPDHPDVARDLDNLALLLQATNRLGEAEPLFRRALAIAEATLGPDHPDVAIDLSNLAGLLKETNRPDKAEPLFRRALAIDEASYGRDHPKVGIRVGNLAGLLEATGRLAEAEPLRRRGLAIHDASLGPNHPYVATSLNNLAGLLQSTNCLGEAEPLYRRALKIDEASYGPDHPDVARDLNNLAELLRTTNRPGEAEPLYRRALAIWETSLGQHHPQVAIGLNNLAQLLRETNQLVEAAPLFRRALAILETSLGADHPNTVTARNNLALLLAEQGRASSAGPPKKGFLSRLFGGR